MLKYLRGLHTPGRHFLGSGTGATPSLSSCRINDGVLTAPPDVDLLCCNDDPSILVDRLGILVLIFRSTRRKGHNAQIMRRAMSTIRMSLPKIFILLILL